MTRMNTIGQKMNLTNGRKTLLRILVLLIAVLGVYFFVRGDAFLYHRSVGKIDSVRNKYLKTETLENENVSYHEKYYEQTITCKILNGKHKGQNVTIKSRYAKSQVYDTKYSEGDYIFVDNIRNRSGTLTGFAAGTKRDYYIFTILTLLFGLFLLVGGMRGAFTILSLVLNMIAFYFVLVLYTKGVNILFATIPMVIFFTAMLLFFMYGRSERTLLSFAATIATCAVTIVIGILALSAGGRVDYDFLEYLNQPYEQSDANFIFVSELLVGLLGAVMDVVVTMVMTVDQIAETGGDLGRKSIIRSCRSVGDDLVGTMVNLMLFTNIAACIPAFMLYLRNGVAFHTIIRYNIFFELTRFLTGSIGIVLAIPISSLIAVTFYRRKYRKGGTA